MDLECIPSSEKPFSTPAKWKEMKRQNDFVLKIFKALRSQLNILSTYQTKLE